MPRPPRHVLSALLAIAVLQLALLGVGGVGGTRAEIADRGTRSQSAWPTISLGKRVLAPEPTDRHATITPFAPASYVRVDFPILIGPDAPQHALRTSRSHPAFVLPPSRGPPALA